MKHINPHESKNKLFLPAATAAKQECHGHTNKVPFSHNQSLFHNSRTYKGQPLVLFRKQGCRIHQCQMGICLWKIAQLFLCIEVDIFTEQPQMVCIFQHLVKKASGLFFSACDEQSPYQPECTNGKSGRRHAKIVLTVIAVHQPLIKQRFPDSFHRLMVTDVIGLDEPVRLHQQQG